MKRPLSYALDNIGLIYPAIITKQMSTLFRVSFNLKSTVYVPYLQQALQNILPRFPIFRTYVKQGLFWPYLQENFMVPTLHADLTPCQNYRVAQNRNYPFRLVAYHKTIALEISHLVTDGRGAMQFLQAILAEYARLQGVYYDEPSSIIRPWTPFDPQEIEDPYPRHKAANVGATVKVLEYAFIEPARRLKAPFYHVTQYQISLAQIKAIAKAKQVSLTEWLVALYFTAYQDRMFLLPPRREYRRPIRITVPVDLHAFYPTASIRNFIAMVNLEIDFRLGVFSFDEILHEVHHALRRHLVAKHFQPFLSSSVRSASNKSIAGVPLFVKHPIVRCIHAGIMRHETSALSNLGLIQLPKALQDMVDGVHFIPAPKFYNKRDVAVVSYNDTLTMSVGRICQHDAVERYLYERMVQQGIVPHVHTGFY
jgi:NRPS condensation-like uncharacterized protein